MLIVRQIQLTKSKCNKKLKAASLPTSFQHLTTAKPNKTTPDNLQSNCLAQATLRNSLIRMAIQTQILVTKMPLDAR